MINLATDQSSTSTDLLKQAIMATGMFFFYLTVLLLLLLLRRVDSKDFWGRKTMSVHIRNDLPGDLSVHCKSGDDDLKQQFLPVGGKPYIFLFKCNVWGTTSFWCRFEYGPVLWNRFEVWNGPGVSGSKRQACQQCLWAVRTDAFYRGEDGTNSLIAVWPWRSDSRPPLSLNASEEHHP